VRIYLLGTALNVLRLVVPVLPSIALAPETGRQMLNALHLTVGDAVQVLYLSTI
jgi:hypothetical protein